MGEGLGKYILKEQDKINVNVGTDTKLYSLAESANPYINNPAVF